MRGLGGVAAFAAAGSVDQRRPRDRQAMAACVRAVLSDCLN